MKFAIFCEGRSDAAVITNILKGILNIDKSDIMYSLPELEYDETDLFNQKISKFGSWTLVKDACVTRKTLRTYFENQTTDTEYYAIIQIDSAERNENEFNVIDPPKSKNYAEYSTQLHENIKTKMSGWLNNEYSDKIIFAICIEEIEAWLITRLTDYKSDTSKENKPKEFFKSRWEKLYSKQQISKIKNMNTFDEYYIHSIAFRKHKSLEVLRKKNISLDIFCTHLQMLQRSTN